MVKTKRGATTCAESVPSEPPVHMPNPTGADRTVSQSVVAELEAPISPPEFLIGRDRATGRFGHRNVN